MKKGDKVQYKAKFLRDIGANTGNLPHAKGVVVDVEPLGKHNLVTIDWDLPYVPTKVLDCNLKLLTDVEVL